MFGLTCLSPPSQVLSDPLNSPTQEDGGEPGVWSAYGFKKSQGYPFLKISFVERWWLVGLCQEVFIRLFFISLEI